MNQTRKMWFVSIPNNEPISMSQPIWCTVRSHDIWQEKIYRFKSPLNSIKTLWVISRIIFSQSNYKMGVTWSSQWFTNLVNAMAQLIYISSSTVWSFVWGSGCCPKTGQFLPKKEYCYSVGHATSFADVGLMQDNVAFGCDPNGIQLPCLALFQISFQPSHKTLNGERGSAGPSSGFTFHRI